MTIGLTTRMNQALGVITKHVAMHGVAPSMQQLADMIGAGKGNAQRLVACLRERGAITRIGGGGPGTTLAFGEGCGVGVMLPPHVAASLAKFCADKGESIQDVAADAITLHIDAMDGEVE